MVALSCVTAATIGSAIAGAASDLGTTADTIYSIDTAAAVVHVRTHYVLNELKPDQSVSGGKRFFFFTGFNAFAVSAVTNLAVTEDGKPLKFTSDNSGSFQRLDITFARNLRFGQPQTVIVEYDLTGSAPRTSADPSRVNAAYAAFGVYAFGDSGASSVKVVAPPGFVFDIQGGPMVTSTDGDNPIASAAAITDPNTFFAGVSARNDANLTSSDLHVADQPFLIRSWPGDAAWADFVTQHVTSGVPELVKLIGQPWPEGARTTDVHEAYTPYLYGYAGWFDAHSDSIEIGENLDEGVVYHELAHAWFNSSLFSERWINEGMAQEFASQSVHDLGGALTKPNPIDPAAAGALSLIDWSNPSDDHAGASETFGYNASWRVIRAITDEIGLAKMGEVIAAAANHIPAYGDRSGQDASPANTDWRRFLDLVDQIGGATKADDQFINYVAGATARQAIDDRATARALYTDLGTATIANPATSSWKRPLAVRAALESWAFGDATKALTAATAVLGLIQKMASVQVDGSSAPLDDYQKEYESASTTDALDKLVAKAQRQLDDRIATAAKQAADKAAAAAAAAKLEADRAAARQAEVDSARAALADARTARRQAGGLLATVGLFHSDVDRHLLAAERALASGDLGAVHAEVAVVRQRVGDATTVGQRRLGIASGGAFVVVGAIVGLTMFRRRRHRRTGRQVAAEAAATGWLPPDPGSVVLHENAFPGTGISGGQDGVDQPIGDQRQT
jgi:hypothetical protein